MNPAIVPQPAVPPSTRSIATGLAGDRRFLVVVLVLAIAAGGLNAAVRFLRVHFKKEPVPIRVEKFGNIPQVIGSWVRVARDENLTPELLHALGTDQYLFCTYLDSSRLQTTPEALLRDFKDLSIVQQQEKAAKLVQMYRCPEARLLVAMTYYTGKADTVAHIPERCYVGKGYDPVNPSTVEWVLPTSGRSVETRSISFTDPQLPGLYSNVAYFFHVNGRFTSDSLRVREQLQGLSARYGYYAKVELMCVTPASDRGVIDANASMREFLDLAIPHVELALPDWSQYEARN